MKKLMALLLGTLTLLEASLACTTFLINKNGQLVFGRNYDWVTGNGMICTNQRGLAKTSRKTNDGETISWVSQYGSISFNQYGKEFPTGGMNEKGLVVELMWLDGTQYPAADDRPAIGILQWIQYQLDNCSSIEEVIATDSKLRIAAKGSSPLHYLIADAHGNAATIEFLEGKMVVHKGKDLPLPALTNDRYDWSLQQTTGVPGQPGDRYTFTSNSIERFAKACNRIKLFDGKTTAAAIDYSFAVLDEVAQGSHTKWSIVYDIANKKIYFKTLGFTAVKNAAFSDFDLSCTSASKAWDMNQAATGPVAKLFRVFSIEMNKEIVTRSFTESISQFQASEEWKQGTWSYPETIACQKANKNDQN